MFLALLLELMMEAALVRDSEELEAQAATLQTTFAVQDSDEERRRRRRESAPMVFLSGKDDDASNRTKNPSKWFSNNDGEGRDNSLLESLEYLIKAGLPDDIIKESTTSIPPGKGRCLKKYFKLHYCQHFLNNLYKDCIKAGLYKPKDRRDSPTDEAEIAEAEAEAEEGAMNILELALQSQPDAKIYDILKKQFKENSMIDRMIGEDVEVVWCHDYFPSHDPVFGLLVNRTIQSIQVVFQGTTTIDHWISNLKYFYQPTPNPIKEDYPNKKEYLRFHHGFQNYLLRQRIDTQQPWHDTICDIVECYGKTMLNGKYHVRVTGHSLGGALSTIFGFYASLDPRMTSQGPVIIESFAAPMVGDHYFADAFRHQEQRGKVRHVRFYNEYDLVPYVPINWPFGDVRGSPWAHTGIGICLLNPENEHSWSLKGILKRLFYAWCKQKMGQQGSSSLALLKYACAKSYWETVIDAIKSNVYIHMDLINVLEYHLMPMHQERLQLAISVSENDGCTSWTKQSMQDIYRIVLNQQEEKPQEVGSATDNVDEETVAILKQIKDSLEKLNGSKNRFLDSKETSAKNKAILEVTKAFEKVDESKVKSNKPALGILNEISTSLSSLAQASDHSCDHVNRAQLRRFPLIPEESPGLGSSLKSGEAKSSRESDYSALSSSEVSQDLSSSEFGDDDAYTVALLQNIRRSIRHSFI